MTDTLTDLDGAVARAMGWRFYGEKDGRCLSPDGVWQDDPRFSAPEYSGFAPVVAWLRDHAPPGSTLEFAVWRDCCGARYVWLPEDATDIMCEKAPTLPEAACRLVVAWAERGTQ